MEKESNNRRIAKNTFFLYIRTFLVMGISIYTSRVVLDVLGVEDYGIYNVVGGFVTMFSVLSGTLTAASQRYIAFELGKEQADVKKVFSTTVNIHLILAGIILVLLESIGLWFLNYEMNISTERLTAANWVFQCSVLTFCVNLISIPYNAAIVAYEKMSAFAYISIFEVIAKLACVYTLYIIIMDSLVLYGIFMLVVAVLLRLIYSTYCIKYFSDCRYETTLDKAIFKEMIGFCGWNFIGSTAGVLNNHGINLLVNIFFGVTLNAARGIAMQVDSAINTFVQNFLLALSPQITKSFAAGNYKYVNELIIRGTKFAFFLFFVIALPVIMNTDFLLSIWLKKVPEYAALFCKLAIIYTMCQTLSHCLYVTMLATGKIKKYQIIVGTLSIMAFPGCYLFFKIGLPAEYGYISMILFSLLCLIARIVLIKEMLPFFSPVEYIKMVIGRIALTVLPVIGMVFCLHSLYPTVSFAFFLLESTECVIISTILIYLFGLDYTERRKLNMLVSKKILNR